ncbi:LOW QUALITY PROTEIN: hypothetical protein MAR_019367, partial [Mya arenaria]
VYQKFEGGNHVVRRRDSLWAGLSVYPIIEQVLMRSIKTIDGLTRGRGMTEEQRVTGPLAIPTCAEVNDTMQELTIVNYNTGGQNKDMADTRQTRDMKDTNIVLNHILERNPFYPDPSEVTGVHAHITVKVDKAKTIGNNVLTRVHRHRSAEYTFKKKDKAVYSVKIGGEAVEVDVRLLFQRLTVAASKAVLADAIWALLTPDLPEITGQVQDVLDGGALVQRNLWTRGPTYNYICRLYTEYVKSKCGEAIDVFDGYEATKDMTNQRRAGGRTGSTMTFNEDMPLQ